MTDPDIIEAAEHALQDWFNDEGRCHGAAKDVVAAVTPMIRTAALEDVVQVIVHSQHIGINATVELVRAVRALKEQP